MRWPGDQRAARRPNTFLEEISVLLMPNKKKIASTIVMSMRPKKDFVQEMGEENGTGEYKLPESDDDDALMGLEAAMDDFIKATDQKDAKGMAKAFKLAMYLCESEGPTGPEAA